MGDRKRQWDTGISLPVKNAEFVDEDIFPKQEYNWGEIDKKIAEYADLVISAIK